MKLTIKDIAETVNKIAVGIDDTTPKEIREIIETEVLMIKVEDVKDRRLIYLIANFMDVIEEEYKNIKDQEDTKLNRLVERMVNVYSSIIEKEILISKVKKIASAFKTIYNNIK